MMTAQRSTARKDAGLQLTQTPHPRHREQREAIQKKQRWFDIFLDCRAVFQTARKDDFRTPNLPRQSLVEQNRFAA